MKYHKSVPEQDNNLINFIATTVETMRDQVETMGDQMATKDDLARVESQMATRLEAMRDQIATKDDLARVELKLDTKMTAIRGDIEQVQVRLDSIDQAVTARMGTVESEISRLRSVLYLLVKDKPDMLRLLGQPTPGESRP